MSKREHDDFDVEPDRRRELASLNAWGAPY